MKISLCNIHKICKKIDLKPNILCSLNRWYYRWKWNASLCPRFPYNRLLLIYCVLSSVSSPLTLLLESFQDSACSVLSSSFSSINFFFVNKNNRGGVIDNRSKVGFLFGAGFWVTCRGKRTIIWVRDYKLEHMNHKSEYNTLYGLFNKLACAREFQ